MQIHSILYLIMWVSHVHRSGQFKVKWIYVKDVPNNQVKLLVESLLNQVFHFKISWISWIESKQLQLRHIKLENNENKPVTNSRDTQVISYNLVRKSSHIMYICIQLEKLNRVPQTWFQEVLPDKGRQVLKILHSYKHTTRFVSPPPP